MKTYPYVDVSHPMVLAHRGDSLHAPENTLPAFHLAAALGVDALETDVHWTKDGVIVVCHDETVDRTSDGQGAIRDRTLAELRKLDFGYSFTTDGGQTYPFRGKGIQIPTLHEVLTTFPDLRVNIDIKTEHPESLQSFIHEVFRVGAEHRVLAASFHDGVLRQLRAMNQTIATSASTLETAKFCGRLWLHLGAPTNLPYGALQVPVRSHGLQIVTEGFIKMAHSVGTKVHVWTIDDEFTMKALLELGVDGIVSNDPSLAVKVRNEHLLSRSA
jgi:glycerophosphoryl diester phosphodiesterase